MNSSLSHSPRIAILGASGFLGTNLAQTLEAETALRAHVLLAGRSRTPAHPKCSDRVWSVAQGDTSSDDFMDQIRDWRPTHVFHLAVFNEAQAEAMVRMVDRASPRPVCVVTGSIAEYDLHKPTEHAVVEDFPEATTGDYSLGKVSARRLLWNNAHIFTSGLTWAVLPQLWGPGDSNPRVWNALLTIEMGRPLFVVGDATNRIPDGSVSTVAQALKWLGLRSHWRQGMQPVRLNVAGPTTLTPLTFLRQAAARLGQRLRLIHLQANEFDSLRTEAGNRISQPFSSKSMHLELQKLHATGFVPTLSFCSGIDHTVDYFQKTILPATDISTWTREQPTPTTDHLKRVAIYDN